MANGRALGANDSFRARSHLLIVTKMCKEARLGPSTLGINPRQAKGNDFIDKRVDDTTPLTPPPPLDEYLPTNLPANVRKFTNIYR